MNGFSAQIVFRLRASIWLPVDVVTAMTLLYDVHKTNLQLKDPVDAFHECSVDVVFIGDFNRSMRSGRCRELDEVPGAERPRSIQRDESASRMVGDGKRCVENKYSRHRMVVPDRA
jgi:hypothetical protein